MNKTKTLTAVALLVAVTVGCGGASSGTPGAKSDAPGSGSTAAGAATAGGAKFGVPECDDYIQKYMACVDSKVPEQARAAMRQGFEQSREAWKRAAETPQGKAGLAMACTQARDAAKASMGAYGCSF